MTAGFLQSNRRAITPLGIKYDGLSFSAEGIVVFM